MKMLFGKKKVLGLDIGSSMIKLAEVDLTRKGAHVNSFAVIATPPNTNVSGEIVNPQGLSEGIAELVREINTKRKNVNAGLWGTSVIVKRISVPRMEPALLEAQIPWEAENYIPYSLNEVNIDYKVLDNVSQNSESMDVLLIAGVQEMVFTCAEVISAAGLMPSILDVEGFALANCFEQNYGKFPGQAIGLLNIGASFTNFVVLESSDVVFCRDIPVGGSTYTNEIHKSLGVSIEEAEAIKMSVSQNMEAPAEATNVINSTHELISDEIAGSIEFYLNTSNSQNIDQYFVTGGCTKTPGLMEHLSQHLANLQRFDPFVNVTFNAKKISPDYIEQVREFMPVAIGLGMRTVEDS